ncbi:MAG: phytanoyl-CoA dioxygenase family protein [Proteobacteria bacterium]|nr:phytanoyl-CoA dioxygenase family protein [Pseudomonadota bacterium]
MRNLFATLLGRARPAAEPAPPAVAEPPAAAPVRLEAGSPAQHVPTQGLVIVEYRGLAETPRQATLQVRVAGADKPALEKTITIGPDAAPAWFALHGHLLPNGPTPITLRLSEGGQTLAETALTLMLRNEGPTAEAVARSLKASGAPLIADGVCDSRTYDYADRSLAAWFDQGPEAVDAYLTDLAARGAATPEEVAALRHFVDEGYMLLPARIEPELVTRLNAALDDAVEKKVEGYEWGASQRLHNLHLTYPAIRELWLHPAVMRMLSLIFGEPAKPCQSLTYVFGSEQQFHQDGIHLTPFPAGRMCGVWTALEDVQPESGELLVYPRSHRLERIYLAESGIPKVGEDWTAFGETVAKRWEDQILSNDLAKEPYRPKAGEVLIWHDNLMHGGMVRRDREKSRRSIVGHYFANGCIAYHDSSGMAGRLFEGEPA